jgi:Lsr2
VVMRLVETFEDDLEGGPADVTVSFGLDGTSYEIDLTHENAERLRAALKPFLAAARPVSPPKARRRSVGRSASVESPALVREWAKETGLEINERGRIPAGVLTAYRAAHGG